MSASVASSAALDLGGFGGLGALTLSKSLGKSTGAAVSAGAIAKSTGAAVSAGAIAKSTGAAVSAGAIAGAGAIAAALSKPLGTSSAGQPLPPKSVPHVTGMTPKQARAAATAAPTTTPTDTGKPLALRGPIIQPKPRNSESFSSGVIGSNFTPRTLLNIATASNRLQFTPTFKPSQHSAEGAAHSALQ